MDEDEKKEVSEMSTAMKVSVMFPMMYSTFWMAAIKSLQAPFFPKEAENKGATPSQYGFVFGIYELVVIITSPMWAKLIPKVSTKYLLIFGILLCGVSCCLFGMLNRLPAGNLYLAACFAVRIFEGIGAAASKTSCYTTTASAFPDSPCTMLSLLQTSAGVGLIIGPSIGGALYQLGGFTLPFVVSGLLALLGCLFVAFFIPSVGESGNTGSSLSILEFLLDFRIIAYSFSMAMPFLFLGFNAATLEPHLRQFELSPVDMGLMFVVLAASFAIANPLVGRLCDSHSINPMFIIIAGYVLGMVGELLIGPAPIIPLKTKRNFPNNLATYSMVSGFVATTSALGSFIGPTMGGLLMDATGYINSTIIVFGIEFVFFVFCIIVTIVDIIRDKSYKNLHPEEHSLCNSITPLSSYKSLTSPTTKHFDERNSCSDMH